MNPAIYKEAYDYFVEQDQTDLIDMVQASIDEGFSPEEIEHHWLRQAGLHRIALAKKLKNTAYYLLENADT